MHPSLNPRRRPHDLFVTAAKPQHYRFDSVLLSIDRKFTDVRPDQEGVWSTLSEVEGSGGQMLEWRDASLFEANRPGDGLTIPIDSAQRLMDSLWGCGLRPTEGSGSAGSLAATQAHLASLERILNHILAAPNPLADPLSASQGITERLVERTIIAEQSRQQLSEAFSSQIEMLRSKLRDEQ
jgi:hypothetical protein